MRDNKFMSWFVMSALLMVAASVASADERDPEVARQAALGKSPDIQKATWPKRLPDLTKGKTIPPRGKGGPITWNMGPTGIIGIKNGGFAGPQVRVVAVLPGSPAEGKVLRGDVVLGVQGQDFVIGGHLGLTVGNAIIKAETAAGKGVFKMHIWRDRNWIKRSASNDVSGVDIDKLLKDAENEDGLYEWKPKAVRKAILKDIKYDQFPLDGVHLNVTLQLKVMGTYSDTSPWDCPVAKKIREDAWKWLAANQHKRNQGGFGAGWEGALALVASGKPEYRKVARTWVHNQKLQQDMNAKVVLKHGSYQSWHRGFSYLDMAIYYDATGDDYVLPELRYRAIETAMGQGGGGSWGHTLSFPTSNAGRLHMHNPGYGALNAAGTRCFFLVALAKKCGIDHPEIDAAIKRASRFFGTFVDKGAIPYGCGSPAGTDDSNGKNFGAAYGFYALGRKHEAKYFSMCSNHAAFTRRGGHGSSTLWYYTPLSAIIAGPRGVIASMRNMRWFYTLSRRHDGSFVKQGEQAGIGGKPVRNPTATHAMYYSAPLRQLITTGKDADKDCWFTDEELDELLVSARGTLKRGQITDPVLLKQVGKPWNQRGSDELIAMLDHFYPILRHHIAKELGKRYQAGEKDIATKVLPLLKSKEARQREGACRGLAACGPDAVLGSMSKVVALLDDDAEFVRMAAVRTISSATRPGDRKSETAMLQAAAEDYGPMSSDHGNVRTAVRNAIFPGVFPGTGARVDSKLTTEPFEAGLDEKLVRTALSRIVTMDQGGMVPITWSRDTVIKLAGPIVSTADAHQINDQGGAGRKQALAILIKHGYRQAAEGDINNLIQRNAFERAKRNRVKFKHWYISPTNVKNAPGLYRDSLGDLHLWLQDNPTYVAQGKEGLRRTQTPLNELVKMVEKSGETKPAPSILPDVVKMFNAKLAEAGSPKAQLKLCRDELKGLQRKNYFRKIAAMSHLATAIGADSLDDVSPFIGHEHWRLREHANKLVAGLIKIGDGAGLIKQFASAEGERAAGMLIALADAAHKPALVPAKAALKHKNPVVRKAAVQAVLAIGGDAELDTVFAFMRQAREPEDLHGCELALLSRRGDRAHVKRVSEKAIALLTRSEPVVRRSLAWVLGQFGGTENLAAIQAAASTTRDEADLREMVRALAYSPDRAADSIMLEIAKVSKLTRDVVASLSVHRMVGPNGYGDVKDGDRVIFARAMLNMKFDDRLITFLGNVHTGPAVQLLFDVMKKSKRNDVEVAVKGIIECVEGMDKPSPADAAIVTKVLAQVIEYIEVSHLRGGLSAHMSTKFGPIIYANWKKLQTRAGRALLKVRKSGQQTLPGLDDLDEDL
jgi:hypothetical protein